MYQDNNAGERVSPNSLVDEAKKKFDQNLDHLKDEFRKVHTGRATPSMLDGVKAMAYGQSMPLVQLAQVTAPEAQLLQITPFDQSNVKAIADAIRNDQSLGFNPTDDGRVVRVPIPPLTQERRQQIVKQLGEKVEECHVRNRSARHDALDKGRELVKSKDWGEDDFKRFEKQVEDLMAKQKADIDALSKDKEKEIMTI
jgi:ribosome recycling factor